MNHLAKKKYVKNKVKRAYVSANVTIPKRVINIRANELYEEFDKLSEREQNRLIFSDELLIVLTDKHIETLNKYISEQ